MDTTPESTPESTPETPQPRLQRNYSNRWLGGIFSAIAKATNSSPFAVQILGLLLWMAAGNVILWLYLFAWLVIPLKPLTDAERAVQKRDRKILSVILFVLVALLATYLTFFMPSDADVTFEPHLPSWLS